MFHCTKPHLRSNINLMPCLVKGTGLEPVTHGLAYEVTTPSYLSIKSRCGFFVPLLYHLSYPLVIIKELLCKDNVLNCVCQVFLQLFSIIFNNTASGTAHRHPTQSPSALSRLPERNCYVSPSTPHRGR